MNVRRFPYSKPYTSGGATYLPSVRAFQRLSRNPSASDLLANRKAACGTYIEQTKLLVTLSSAFLVAPPGLIVLLKDRSAAGLASMSLTLFLIVEAIFVLSVVAGYVVLGTIAGSQDSGEYDVFRLATRIASLLQLVSYLAGLSLFVALVQKAIWSGG